MTLTSISPSSGPPGAAITLTGTGFTAESQAACPVLVPTTYASPTSLSALVPDDLVGAAGTSLAVGVYVRNADGTASAALVFTVVFPAVELQSWTELGKVCGEVPGFKRGGRILDDQILVWMRTVAQSVAGAMLRRGLSTEPATWQLAAAGTAGPAAVGVLEMINRLGAAARLAAAIASDWGGAEWGLAKNLEREYTREKDALGSGGYDKLFRPGAATVESGPLLAAGDTALEDGSASAVFTKGKVF